MDLVFPRILALSKIYIWICFSWKLVSVLQGRGGNNRMLLRRMLMREGSDQFAKNKFTHAAGQGLSRPSGESGDSLTPFIV